MHAEKLSEMIANFIGFLDLALEDDRMRIHLSGGKVETLDARPHGDLESLDPGFASNLVLDDYDPSLFYRNGIVKFVGGSVHLRIDDHDYEWGGYWRPSLSGPGDPPFMRPALPSISEDPELKVFMGPGSIISHMSQFNLLQDDDYLNLLDDRFVPLDTRFVVDRLNEYTIEAKPYVPFSGLDRVDTYEGLTAIRGQIRDYAQNIEDNHVQSLNAEADVDFVLVGRDIEGIYVNGQRVEEAPDIDDYMPDRGIAAPPSEPEESDVSLSSNDAPKDRLEVEAGANIVVNVAAVTNVGIMAPVMAVMGDYSQADIITQFTIYSDHDVITYHPLGGNQEHDTLPATTVAMNIGIFERSTYEMPSSGSDGTHAPVFPTNWQVSVVEGDVSFVQWMEQYNFITDNDQMVITTTGNEMSVIIGGNTVVNFASYLGMSLQYDLVIVGGNVLDMNIISQVAVLYDNDWIVGAGSAGATTDYHTSGNLLWNSASIHNVGPNDRFEEMPDYMVKTVEAIEDRDPMMPAGLATDPNFEGFAGLKVLYITGNLYDISLIKQVNVIGDADHVTEAANMVLSANPDAEITVGTGSNAVVNLASIVDYDTFGATTYVGGNLYSDAILIQGGIIDDDDTQPQPVEHRLANEVIAFLDDNPDTADSDDAIISSGRDLSWSNVNPADVMQTVLH